MVARDCGETALAAQAGALGARLDRLAVEDERVLAAARAAAHLVEINLGVSDGDERLARAQRAAKAGGA